jgi:hypothetical protein
MTWLALAMNRWVQLAAGTALALVLGFGLGHHQKTLEDASAALSGAKRAVQTVGKQAAVNSTVDQHTTAAMGAIQARTVTLIQKVPLYVTRKADDQCIVSAGAVRLLDAAAGDTVPAAPIGLQDADSGVALSSLVSDAIVNAGNYKDLAERLKAWDDWYDGQSGLTKH